MIPRGSWIEAYSSWVQAYNSWAQRYRPWLEPYRSAWLGILALATATLGEVLLAPDSTNVLSLVLLLLGALLAMLAWRDRGDIPLPATGRAWNWRQLVVRRDMLLRLGAIAVSGMLAICSVLAYRADPQAIFGLQGWLWLVSMGLLVAACARWPDQPYSEYPVWTHAEILVLLALVITSFCTHLAWLGAYPWRFQADEVIAYQELSRFYPTPTLSLFTTAWRGTSLPTLWLFLAAQPMHLIGTGLAAVRLGVAVVGAALVVPVYALARLAWGRRAAALAAFAVSVSAVAVQYSRISIANMTTAFWWSCCFYFLLHGLRSRRPIDFALAGLAAGTSQYTYYGTRLLPILLVIYLAYLALFHWQVARGLLFQFGIMLLGFVAGFGPLIGYFLDNPAMWAGRGVLLLTLPHGLPTTWHGWVTDWHILTPLLWRDFLGFSVLNDGDGFYFLPLLQRPEAALLFMGTGVLLWRWRQPASFLVLLWGLGTLFTGGLLIDASTVPSFNHWIPAFPAFYLAMALPLALLTQEIERLPSRIMRVGGYALLACALVADGAGNANAFLAVDPARVSADRSLEASLGRFIEQMGPATFIGIVGNTWVMGAQESAWSVKDLMGPHTPVNSIFNPSRELPLVGDPKHNLAFLFYNDMYPYVRMVRYYYPDGTVSNLKTPGGALYAMAYRVPAAQALRRYGVWVEVADARGGTPRPAVRVAAVGVLPGDVRPGIPVTATWSGAVHVDQPGPIQLGLRGASPAAIWLQGRSLSPGATLSVDAGWVPFRIQARVDRRAPVHFWLRQGGRPATDVDTYHLWPVHPDQGIAATLVGSAIKSRIDPFIGASFAVPPREHAPQALPLVAPTTSDAWVRWVGRLYLNGGTYTMELRSDEQVQLTIDNTTVLKACRFSIFGATVTSGHVRVAPGWHRVRIDYHLRSPRNGGLEWFWIRPGGAEEVVPPDALRFGPLRNGTTGSSRHHWVC